MNINLRKRKSYYYLKKLFWSKNAAYLCQMWGRRVQNNTAIDTLHVNADYQGKTKSATVRPEKRFKKKSLTTGRKVLWSGQHG